MTSANGWMGMQPICGRETTHNEIERTENAASVQMGPVSVVNRGQLCYVFKNGFISPPVIMPEALQYRSNECSSQAQMKGFPIPRANHALPDIFSDNSHNDICNRSMLIQPDDHFLRMCQLKAEAAEHLRQFLSSSEQHFQQHAKQTCWAQYFQRIIVSDSVDRSESASESIMNSSSRLNSTRDWDKKPASSINTCRNPEEAMNQCAMPSMPIASLKPNVVSCVPSLPAQHIHNDDSQTPAEALKQKETPPPPPEGLKVSKGDSKWLKSLGELKEFKQSHGHTIVPRGYLENPKLASWVAEQRKQYRLQSENRPSAITQKRIDILNELGFTWNAQESVWLSHFDDLRRFYEDRGHCNVRLRDVEYPKLGLWVKEQRRHFALEQRGKASHLTNERVRLLNSLNFCFSSHSATWQSHFCALKELHEEYGRGRIPAALIDPKLTTWIHHQRRQYRKKQFGKPHHISPGRIKALNGIGFAWTRQKNDFDADDESLCSDVTC